MPPTRPRSTAPNSPTGMRDDKHAKVMARDARGRESAGDKLQVVGAKTNDHVAEGRRAWMIDPEDRVVWQYYNIGITGMESASKVYNLHELPDLFVLARGNTRQVVVSTDKYVVFIMSLRACLMHNPHAVENFTKLHRLQSALYASEQRCDMKHVCDMFDEHTTLFQWVHSGVCVLYDVCVIVYTIERDMALGVLTPYRKQTLHLQMLEFEKMSAMADSNDVVYFRSPWCRLGVVEGKAGWIPKTEHEQTVDDYACLRLKNAVCCHVRDHILGPMRVAVKTYEEENGMDVTVW